MTKPLYSYGDEIRHRIFGVVRTITDKDDTTYRFSDGTFAIIDDQDSYELVRKASGYFEVAKDIDKAPLDDYLHHGYETREDFRDAVRKLIEYWGGRYGECVNERNKFLLLRFHDTPGGFPDEAWLPLYLLTPLYFRPVYIHPGQKVYANDLEREIDKAFGFEV